MEKFPPVMKYDTISEVIYRDTVIFVHLPGENRTDSVMISFPCPEGRAFHSDTVRAFTRFASSSAWISGKRLKIELIANDTLLSVVIDSAVTETLKKITVQEGRIVHVKYIPPLYRASLWINIFLFVLLLGVLYVSLRRK